MIPKLITAIPGPKSLELGKRLKKVEAPTVTYISDDFPIFWKKAQGSWVWDVDGNQFLDLTSAFGVATLGHRPEAMVKTIQEQSELLVHGMGDVHPSETKVELCEAISAITWERWTGEKAQSLLMNSGSDAIEAALKTAYLKTGKNLVVSFKEAYHGLGYGALTHCGSKRFSEPFNEQLQQHHIKLDYPKDAEGLALLEQQLSLIEASKVGAVLVEPIQARAGTNVPPPDFLPLLRQWTQQQGACLILDEIYTGFFRTGSYFACEQVAVVPDMICIAKALTGGYPISACVGSIEVMSAWPESTGEALHTSTYLGNPLGCAIGVTAIKTFNELQTQLKIKQACTDWQQVLNRYVQHPLVKDIKGLGLMWAVEWDNQAIEQRYQTSAADWNIQLGLDLLQKGIITLPEGNYGELLGLSPNIMMSKELIEWACEQIFKI